MLDLFHSFIVCVGFVSFVHRAYVLDLFHSFMELFPLVSLLEHSENYVLDWHPNLNEMYEMSLVTCYQAFTGGAGCE